MYFRRSIVAALAVLAVSFVGAVASATVLEEVSLEDMSARSDAIVHGVVETSGTRWVLDDNEPNTITTIRVRPWPRWRFIDLFIQLGPGHIGLDQQP